MYYDMKILTGYRDSLGQFCHQHYWAILASVCVEAPVFISLIIVPFYPNKND